MSARYISPRLETATRRLVHAAGLLLAASGIAILPWDRVTEALGRAGQTAARDLHGAAAMLALVLIGMLLPRHVGPGWSGRVHRSSGAIMLGLLGLLVATGYLLYYAGGEATRDVTSLAHQVAGFAAVAGYLVHRWVGSRRRRRLAP